MFNKHPKREVLFKTSHGRTHLEIWGPRIGWHWRTVELFRWEKSNKKAGAWGKVLGRFNITDLPHVKKCITEAAKWAKEDDPKTNYHNA